MKFTQEIKDNWIKNLESGKYTQGFATLEQTIDDQKYHCCLGVLGDCTEGLSNELGNPYDFITENLGSDLERQLWSTNDDIEYEKSGKRDYSNVLELIKSLPVRE